MTRRKLEEGDTLELQEAIVRTLYKAQVAQGYVDPRDVFSFPNWMKQQADRALYGRLEEFRDTYIPWLEKHFLWEGCRVLEVGAGTGSSTVAMAERGAHVHGIDIEEDALEVARLRCRMHGLENVSFDRLNATEIEQCQGTYDLIIYFATLEHMTHAERMVSLDKSWNKLADGGFVAVVECPNRLWYFDVHTTLMNFYNWLPNEVAIDYRKFITRENFSETFTGESGYDEQATKLARWGRGASHHEFDLAFGPVSQLDVREGLMDFRRSVNRDLDAWWAGSAEGRYRELLRGFAPEVPSAFFYPWLDLLVRKR